MTDASDPNFDPETFRLGNYKNHQQMANAFEVMFPLGTNRREVENILMNAGVANVSETKLGSGKNTRWEVRYTEHFNPLRQFKEAASHIFIFDSNENLVDALPFLGGGIYSDHRLPQTVTNKDCGHD